MDPMCVRAANTLMRLCICPGSSELSMLAYKQTSLSNKLACVSNVFFATSCPKKKRFVPEEEADFSSISKYILH